jgi:hypothetical protein
VQIAHKPTPESEAASLARDGRGSSRYTSRVMSLADTRGVSVLWFNAPIEPAASAPAAKSAAPVACATAAKN